MVAKSSDTFDDNDDEWMGCIPYGTRVQSGQEIASFDEIGRQQDSSVRVTVADSKSIYGY